jgi:hypothetical protein
MPSRSTISPTKDEGTWALKEYFIVVEKKGLRLPDHYYVEIVHAPGSGGVVWANSYAEDGPCEAALMALISFLGPRSKEVNEFVTHYPCKGGQPHYPPGSGVKIDNDLDGVQRKPAWIR